MRRVDICNAFALVVIVHFITIIILHRGLKFKYATSFRTFFYIRRGHSRITVPNAREDKDMTEKVKDRQTATKGLLDQVPAQLTLT